MKPVTVMGAGPSGLTAAINLAKAGYPVEVYDKKADAGGRFYGDLQGLENWSEKQDVLEDFRACNLSINFDCDPFTALYLTDGEGTDKHFTFSRPLFYLVKRGTANGSLDQALKHQALQNGVSINLGKAVSEKEADIVAKGPEGAPICAIDKGIIFETSLPDMAIGIVNDELAYKGYAYLLITGGYGCLCTVMFDQFKAIDEAYEKAKAKIEQIVDLDIKNPTKVGGRGTFNVKGIFRQNGRFYVGESTGLQDALWGFGIRFAVQSGHMAAQSYIHGDDYQSRAYDYFQPKRKATIVLRYLYEKLSKNGYSFLIRHTASKSNTIQFLRRAHSYKWVHKLIYPFALRKLRKRYESLA